MTANFVTVGHSTRTSTDFIEMIRMAKVTMVADVRSFPRSKTNPAYNIDVFPDLLEKYQISYQHFPALGGRRKKQTGVEDDLNTLWRVRSFQNYADYALSDAFQNAFRFLLEKGRIYRIALMCAEAVWWRCHRRIIADYLLLNGHAVDHLMGLNHIEAAKPTPGSKLTASGRVIYPASESS